MIWGKKIKMNLKVRKAIAVKKIVKICDDLSLHIIKTK